MKTRFLSPDELGKLPDGILLPDVDPAKVDMVVIEDDNGEIVATMAAYYVAWVESLWVAEEHRGKAGVIRSLLRNVFAAPREKGLKWVLAMSGSEKTSDYLTRLGGKKVEGQFFCVRVAE